jgi:hypothetical protein
MHILLPAVTIVSAMTEQQTEEQQTLCHNDVVAVIEIVPNPIENTGDAFTHDTR